MFKKVTITDLEALAGTPGPSARPSVNEGDDAFRAVTTTEARGKLDVELELRDAIENHTERRYPNLRVEVDETIGATRFVVLEPIQNKRIAVLQRDVASLQEIAVRGERFERFFDALPDGLHV